MQTFIARENLKLFRRKLEAAADKDERERLIELIEAERERLRDLTRLSSPERA